jgi:hypothetical protein
MEPPEIEQYQRHLSLDGFGEENQHKLKQTTTRSKSQTYKGKFSLVMQIKGKIKLLQQQPSYPALILSLRSNPIRSGLPKKTVSHF